MLEPFLFNPFIALILIAISCSLLGVFVLWKKLAYFGDALSHSILLGLVFGGIFSLNQTMVLIFFAVVFASALSLSFNNRYFSKDTLIAISTYFCLALAVILNDIFAKNFDFSAYVLGDILTAGTNEIYALALVTIVSIIFVIFAFKKILLININRDLAKIEGIKCELWDLAFLILLTLIIALSVRIVGVFLMTALLILPAAIARIFCISAKMMMIYSALIAILSSITSFTFASNYNLTMSAVLILTLSIIFIFSFLIKKYGEL